MMIAELIDLEDFADRLRKLGLALPAGADEAVIGVELEDWLGDASDDELSAFERTVSTLEVQSEGMMLPSVVALIERGRGCIDDRRNNSEK